MAQERIGNDLLTSGVVGDIETNPKSGVPVPCDDLAETQEWVESLDAVLETAGAKRGEALLHDLLDHALSRRVSVKSVLNTPYCNTVDRSDEPVYPGDIALERRITAIIRWNALAMVVRANHEKSELGGHLASYASGADLFEVGFNHFFHGNRENGTPEPGADLVFFQPHSSPGIYARAFLEGRITQEHLDNFRREVGGNGLCSYPHPRLMPDFWQFPTGSMGIGPLTAVYQARFMHYLENRGLLTTSERRVWAFVGDGEMDEPESLAGLALAARENLDNLTFVVNCNLQRLDGPVRGNGSIVQELERLFVGAGWNVVKLLWGSRWDDLFARDQQGLILRRLAETVDGELQNYGANDAAFNRERFFSKSQGLRDLVSHLSDTEIDALDRGGHDPVKIYAAFNSAVRHKGQPTVILAQTKKGYGMGRWGESRMSAHQQKKLDSEALRSFRDRFDLPLSDEDADNAKFYRPPEDSPEMQYLFECRRKLGGFVPSRIRKAEELSVPKREEFAGFAFDSENRESSTTIALVRMLTNLLKEEAFGRRIVPIVADEARTFGMESLFRKIGIYSHCGQLYEPVDKSDFLFYNESRKGQILEEGINEAGALSSWMAAGTSYSHHGLAMLPFYIFYSVFGFQRVGDLIWAAADSRARGFLIGATSGRTTLSGEGLQHQDGTSHLIASTIPSCRAYDPCFAYEIAVILECGMRSLLEKQEDVFYYLTVMNENYVHPAIPPNVTADQIVRGMYLVRPASLNASPISENGPSVAPYAEGAIPQKMGTKGKKSLPQVQLLGSGAILREVMAAAELLEQDWNIAADVWSVTSFTELRREGMEMERWNRFRDSGERRLCWIEQCLEPTRGPIVAATDYVRAVPDLIRAWVPRRYITLGTDGFGRSDTRIALRHFFEVDRTNIALAAIAALADDEVVDRSTVHEFMKRYGYTPSLSPWGDG